jgi:hypothetical protein
MVELFENVHRARLRKDGTCLISINATSCSCAADLFVNAVNTLLARKGINDQSTLDNHKIQIGSPNSLLSPSAIELFYLSIAYLNSVSKRKSGDMSLALVVTYGECIDDSVFSEFISDLHKVSNSLNSTVTGTMRVSVVSVFSSSVPAPLQLQKGSMSQVQIIQMHHTPSPVQVLEDVLTSIFTNSLYPFSLSNSNIRKILADFRGHDRCVWSAAQR